MPRVLHVAKYYAPFKGGMERVVQDLAEGLAAEFPARVLACAHDGRAASDVVNGIPVERASVAATVWSMPISLHYARLLRRLADEADLLVFHHPFPLAEVAGLGKRRRVLVWYHCDVVRQRAVMPVYGPFQRRFLERADRICASSERLRDLSPHLAPHRARTAVVPFGVPPETHAAPEPFPLPDDFVLAVGRLVPYKGFDVLLRAMTRVRVPLVLVGDGRLRGDLEGLARALRVDVRFAGSLPRPQFNHALSRCRLLAFPSVNETEAFGLTQLEAMAHGKAVVNTDLPTGVPEVSRHGETGLTVPVGDADALATAINELLADPAKCARFGEAARARAAQFTPERFLDGARRAYREALA